MGSYHIVTSESNGVVEEVLINEGEYVYEWEPLFLIKSQNGNLKKVELGVSGKINSIRVIPGEKILSDMTLAVVEEDDLPRGCD
ncbi:hypothetical protein [Alkalihalobacterium chitinilyticum]|uniref:Lipoyl-binding domain-containing protein n=1 Tax=Alkalihalobacterium chitinilyticum TaxID=2980103 RepID=A0ABT5VCU6_9BACI|nr:hypothetical protein [Alkalihalobacterium chitinilyticum]MDE5413269.1 hypothetical protein [Alkalihalobacterium chitinilyticum]